MWSPKVRNHLTLPSSLMSLTFEEVSEAWRFLAGVSPSQDCPPPNLQRLTEDDWVVLSHLLDREMTLKARSPLH